MGLFYNTSPKEILEIRNKIFIERGLPALNKNGFKKSPFSTSRFGRDSIKGFTYELCRLTSKSQLEIIEVQIVRGDRWIKSFLNIFELRPEVQSLELLDNTDGLQYKLPPNSVTAMQLRSDDFKGPPLFNYSYMFRNHKLKRYHFKWGLTSRTKELAKIIESDLSNIDYFVKRWQEIHEPMITTWEGKIEGFDKMTINERLLASRLLKEFNVAKKKDTARAKQILTWLQVDELSMEDILNSELGKLKQHSDK